MQVQQLYMEHLCIFLKMSCEFVCEFASITLNSWLCNTICLLWGKNVGKNVVDNSNKNAYYDIGNDRAKMTDS